MNNHVNFAAIGWDDEWERYSIVWQGQCLCSADAFVKMAKETSAPEDGDKILMVALDTHQAYVRYANVRTTVTWEP